MITVSDISNRKRQFHLDESMDTDPNTEKPPEEEQLLRFLQLYNGHYQRMYLFAKTLLPSGSDVDDIMQEVSLAVWKKFPTFQIDTCFSAWVYRMIRIEVMRFLQKKARERRFFDEEFINIIADKLTEQDEKELQHRYEALVECSQALPSKSRELIFEKYFKKHKITEIAKKTSQNVDAVYQQLSRIRLSLRNCVMKKIGQ